MSIRARLFFILTFCSLLLNTLAFPKEALAALTCSINSGQISGNSVTYEVTVSEAVRYTDIHVFLNRDGEMPIEGVKGQPRQDPNNSAGAIVPIVFSNLPYDVRSYRVQVDNPELSTATSSVPCDGASTTNTGQIDVHPGGSTSGGPSSPTYQPPVKKEPCTEPGLSATAKKSCQEKVKCEAKTKQGYVFARAFNNACVTLPDFVQTLINYVMLFSSVIAGFMLLQGGFKVVASRGNPTSLVEARGTILNAVIGLVLLATAYVIIKLLSGMFGYGVSTDINLLGPFVP